MRRGCPYHLGFGKREKILGTVGKSPRDKNRVLLQCIQQLYTADSIKVALGIGNCALGSYFCGGQSRKSLQRVPYTCIQCTIDHSRKYHNIPQCSLFVTPKFCISIVFSFSSNHFNPQEKPKSMHLQTFGMTNKEHYDMLWYFVEWSIANSQCPKLYR